MSLDFTWDTTSALTKGYTTHNVYGRDLLSQKRFSVESPDKDGITEIGKKFSSNIVRAEGRIVGTSYSNLETSIIPAFIAYLYKDTDVQLIFSDKTDRHYNAQMDSYNYSLYASAWRLMELFFLCSDPFAYAVTADTDTHAGIVVVGTQYTLSNTGHYYCYPTITITFNQAQTHIYIANNNITGNRFDISKSFEDEDVLVVNCKNQVIELNDVDSPAGLGDGGDNKASMIMLAVGNNQIEVGTDDADIDVDVTIEWNKVYLS